MSNLANFNTCVSGLQLQNSLTRLTPLVALHKSISLLYLIISNNQNESSDTRAAPVMSQEKPNCGSNSNVLWPVTVKQTNSDPCFGDVIIMITRHLLATIFTCLNLGASMLLQTIEMVHNTYLPVRGFKYRKSKTMMQQQPNKFKLFLHWRRHFQRRTVKGLYLLPLDKD